MRAYLRALFQTDGTVNVSSFNQTCSVRLASVHRPLLQDVQVLLANFGVFTRIHLRREAAKRSLPDGHGNKRDYACQDLYELIADGESRDRFMQEVGFLLPAKREKYEAWVTGKALLKSQRFAARVAAEGIPVATGEFGADMAVGLVNDGPVTIWLDTATL